MKLARVADDVRRADIKARQALAAYEKQRQRMKLAAAQQKQIGKIIKIAADYFGYKPEWITANYKYRPPNLIGYARNVTITVIHLSIDVAMTDTAEIFHVWKDTVKRYRRNLQKGEKRKEYAEDVAAIFFLVNGHELDADEKAALL